jgi:hypothetical protein
MNKKDILSEIKQLVEKMGAILQAAPWENREFYTSWLAQTTYFVQHSTRLCGLASAYCNENQQSYHQRFLHHGIEEKGHEKLSILDLKSFGQELKNYEELPGTRSFYQTQYYWIQHKHPLALFGYIIFLECLAIEQGPKLTQRVTKAYGEKAARFLKVHSEEDIDHVEKAMEQIRQAPADAQEHIIQNLQQSFYNYEALLTQCQEHALAFKQAG